MLRFAVIIAAILIAAPTFAQCPGGVCPRPIRNAIAATPTLARPVAPRTVPVLGKRSAERSVVVRRGFARGPGFLARITFRPQRWR